MGKVSLDLGHEWAGLGDTVAERETAFSVRAGLWREGTEVSSIVHGGKSLQYVMGERLNGAKGQILQGSKLKKREAVLWTPGSPCRLCAERVEDEAAAAVTGEPGKESVMSLVASCSCGAGGAGGGHTWVGAGSPCRGGLQGAVLRGRRTWVLVLTLPDRLGQPRGCVARP